MLGFLTRRPPLVSVIIIFYNGERFLTEAIESVLAQTHRPIELILVDDGSTDGSAAIAREYARRHAFISYHQHEGAQNRGMSASRNLGLRRARGEFVAFLDADDVWLPQKLERQVAVLRQHPEAVLTCSAVTLWTSWTTDPEEVARMARRTQWRDGRPMDRLIRPAAGRFEGLVKPPALLKSHLKHRTGLVTPGAVLVRRREALRVGGFEDAFRTIFEDQVFLSKMALHHWIHISKECLGKYRQHGASACNAAMRGAKRGEVRAQLDAAYAQYLTWVEAYAAGPGSRRRKIRTLARERLVQMEHGGPRRKKRKPGAVQG